MALVRPLAIAGLVAGAVGAALAATSLAIGRDRVSVAAPALVVLAPEAFSYRPAGAFTRNGQPVNAPLRKVRLQRGVAIMTHEVAAADYRRCVLERGCPADPEVGEGNDRPAVQVSWRDADAYARWLSRRLGARYRLPTDEEWAFAAGSRFRDEVLPEGGSNPARRWLARYEEEEAADEKEDGEPRPIGGFGANERGVVDLAGNVWEWTSTCFSRQASDAVGVAARATVNCGIRVAEGRHRAYLPDFVRDARGGGCSAGRPPTYLGFRLVRE